MPTGKINLPWLASRLTEKDVTKLADLVKRKPDPRRAKLERKRAALAAAIKKIDDQIAALCGTEPKSGKRRGRKPAPSAKRGVARPPKAQAAKRVKQAKAATNDPKRAAMLERMAKARAARAAMLAGAQ